MRVCWLVVAGSVCVAMLGGTAQAQQRNVRFGAQVVDVPKAEADKLGWDAPHGAKVSRIEPGSPAEKAGITLGDIVLSLDRTEIDNAADFNASVEGKRPGTEVRLRVLSKGHELRVAVVLDQRQTLTVAGDAPILQLDTGGHMGLIKSLAFTPDGRYLVLAGDDKVIRVWDWQAGTIVRSIRGQAGVGDEGKVYAMALSPDGRWLAAGGYFGTGTPHQDSIRLYEFATGRLVGLFKGHTNVVTGLVFASNSKWLISGSADRTAIIWDLQRRTLAHHLKGHTDAIYAVGFSPDGAGAVTGSDDKTLKLWSVADGSQIATLSGGNDKVRSVAVSGSDGTIASGSVDGPGRVVLPSSLGEATGHDLPVERPSEDGARTRSRYAAFPMEEGLYSGGSLHVAFEALHRTGTSPASLAVLTDKRTFRRLAWYGEFVPDSEGASWCRPEKPHLNSVAYLRAISSRSSRVTGWTAGLAEESV